MINIEEEWAFITHEVHYNKPKVTPYKGNDLIIRELLFMLQNLLSFYTKDKSEFNLTVYQLSKSKYLKLISQKNDNK
jgi:hypothetical protein